MKEKGIVLAETTIERETKQRGGGDCRRVRVREGRCCREYERRTKKRAGGGRIMGNRRPLSKQGRGSGARGRDIRTVTAGVR